MKASGGFTVSIKENVAKASRGSKSGPFRSTWLLLVAVAGLAAYQGGRPEKARPSQAAEMITLEGVKAVIGTANDYASGAIDLSKGSDGITVAYRYYDADNENYETDFVLEIAPKIQALYKRYPSLDSIHFRVTTNSVSPPPLWKPFVEFTVDRKTVEGIHWTGFLTRYLLELILRSEK
jgi:hypothetical protein